MFHGRFLARGAAVAGLVALLVAAGCGDDAKGGDPTKFVGTWKVTAGQLSPTCSGITIPPASLVDEIITITPGTDSALIALVRTCTLKMNISGTTATAQPGQSCAMSVSIAALGAISLNLAVTTGSFTVVDTTATFSQTGTGTLAAPIPLIPAGTSCPYTITASATKNP